MDTQLKERYINTEETLAKYLSSVDVDSYAVCTNNLLALKIEKKFYMNMHVTVNKCKNSKLIASIEGLSDHCH